MSLAPAKPLEDILEREWEATLYNSKSGLAPLLGWRLVYHTLRSKGSRAGFPDRVLVRDRVIFAESKREKKVATPITDDQRDWLDGLAKAGAEVYLWRPSDLDEISMILSKRWLLGPNGLELGNGLSAWRPKTAWVPGIGRVDEVPSPEPEVPGQTTIHDFVS